MKKEARTVFHQLKIIQRTLITIDTRGRITLPAEIIKRTEGEFIITGHAIKKLKLHLFALKDWERFERVVLSSRLQTEEERQSVRFLFSMAYNVSSEHNRILVPKPLRDWVMMKQKGVLEIVKHDNSDKESYFLSAIESGLLYLVNSSSSRIDTIFKCSKKNPEGVISILDPLSFSPWPRLSLITSPKLIAGGKVDNQV